MSTRRRRMMPQGAWRTCTKDCGYKTYTAHTGPLPCPALGCLGELGLPLTWPHICSHGHSRDVEATDLPRRTIPEAFCEECPPIVEG